MSSTPGSPTRVRRPGALDAALWATAGLALALGACREDDRGSAPADESWRFGADAGADSDTLGDNGEFAFVPGPAGTAPGYYVVAETAAGILQSGEVEIRLDQHPSLDENPPSSLGAAQQSLGGELPDPTATPVGRLMTELPIVPNHVPPSAFADPPESPVTIRFAHPATPLLRPPTGLDAMVELLDARAFGDRLGHLRSDAPDTDRDGIPNDEDNCPLVANPAQDDEDEDGVGDSCERDWDGDGIADDGDDSGVAGDNPCNGGREDCDDNCPRVYNVRQLDTDGDGIGDLCDDDRDGNGIADLDEDVDWDGDGIPTSVEGATDTDGDGIPDAFDADDDGDHIPTRDERGRDTDGDGIPDDRDTDSDGDGVPDRYEGNRDTDGDGIPDRLDTDDDGDGHPTRDEIAPPHRDPNGNLVPRWLDPSEDENTEPCATLNPRDIVPTMNTFGGWSPWFVMGYSISFAGSAYSFGWATHFAPEGVYASLQLGAGANFPPELAAAGINFGFGMIRPPEAPLLHASSIEGGSIGFSMSILLYSVGFTIFQEADLRPHRAIQYDLGIGISSSGLFSIPFGISLMRSSMTLRTPTGDPGFVFVHGWGDGCAPGAAKQGETGLGPLVAAMGAAAASPQTDMLSALRAQTAATALPMMQMFTEAGAPPAEGIPASTNGAWMGEFTARTTTSLCRECADMSIDGVVRDAYYRTLLAGEGRQSLTGAAIGATAQAVRAWPDRARHAVVNDLARGAVDATFAHAYENTARMSGAPNRYVADEVRTFRGRVGEPIAFAVTAAEIAELIGAEPEDIEGATLCLRSDFSGPRAGDVCGRLRDGEVAGTLTLDEVTSILFLVFVDLTTAASDFDDQPVERWTVRPPMMLLTTEPGDPAEAVLSAPASIWSGAPTTLAASVIDQAGMIVDGPVTFRFYGPGDVELASVESETGSATYQLQPSGVTPTLSSARITEVTFESGTTVDGLVLEGTGLSRESTVLVGGTDIAERGYELAWIDSKTLVATPTGTDPRPLTPGSTTIEVISPGGATTGPTQVSL